MIRLTFLFVGGTKTPKIVVLSSSAPCLELGCKVLAFGFIDLKHIYPE